MSCRASLGILVVFAAAAQAQNSSTAHALTADQKDARIHFRVAKTAIHDGNYDIALDELQKASGLDAKNSIIWYDLAVVQSKKHMDKDALASLNKAEMLGLPTSLKELASDMRGTLTYGLEKQQKAARAQQATAIDLSADDTLNYLNEKLVAFGDAPWFKSLGCPGPEQMLQISRDRTTLALTWTDKQYSHKNKCKSVTEQMPIFQLETRWVWPTPISGIDERGAVHTNSDGTFTWTKPTTGDYMYGDDGTNIVFACRDMARCIVSDRGPSDTSIWTALGFYAPEDQIQRIRKAVVHLINALRSEANTN